MGILLDFRFNVKKNCNLETITICFRGFRFYLNDTPGFMSRNQNHSSVTAFFVLTSADTYLYFLS